MVEEIQNTNLAKLDTLIATFQKDPSGGALDVIDHMHFETHEGDVYYFGHLYESVANNGTADMHITDSDIPLHTTLRVNTGGTSFVNVYEGTTLSVSGDDVVPQNKNRLFPNANGFTVQADPTIDVLGTPMGTGEMLSGGSAGQKAGSSNVERDEWVLAPNTTYMLRVTNKSGGTIHISISSSAYEHLLE